MINPFPTIHLINLLYFIYGLAFLFLGFSIGTKNMKGSNLRIAESLRFLAMFGFTHGIGDWLGLYPLMEEEHLTEAQIVHLAIISNALLIVSFLFLLHFGLSLLLDNKRKRIQWTAGLSAFLSLLLMISLGPHGSGANMQIMRQVQFGVRNTFGIFGGLVSAYGMMTYSRELKKLNPVMARNFMYAGGVFVFYVFFSSSFFCSIAHAFVPIPAEIFKASAAVLIAYFIMKALNIFDVEMRMKVENQARSLVQSEKLASLGQLAAGIAHEINNPLANASLGMQLLRHKAINTSGQALVEDMNTVEKNIERAAVIAQELLSFSRERRTAFTSLNINEVIAGALALTKYKLKRAVLEQNLASVPDVMGDRGKLEQVFINVLTNALEAMPEGGKISISTLMRGNMVEARIVDTGVGIAEENLTRIFEPFFTTKEVGSGTGLGLSLSYGIIQQHHGQIKITSVVGKGTTVILEIPAVSNLSSTTEKATEDHG